jgi:type IV pilus assembly protein PilE
MERRCCARSSSIERNHPAAVRVGLPRARIAPGFSLIELLIVMVMIGIATAVALPTYREHVRKAARADAQTFLTNLASRQQQYLVDKRRYAASVAALNMTPSASLKAKFEDPVTIEAPDVVPPTFRLVVRAVGDQAYDKCPTLSLDSAGNREPSECW